MRAHNSGKASSKVYIFPFGTCILYGKWDVYNNFVALFKRMCLMRKISLIQRESRSAGKKHNALNSTTEQKASVQEERIFLYTNRITSAVLKLHKVIKVKLKYDTL